MKEERPVFLLFTSAVLHLQASLPSRAAQPLSNLASHSFYCIHLHLCSKMKPLVHTTTLMSSFSLLACFLLKQETIKKKLPTIHNLNWKQYHYVRALKKNGGKIQTFFHFAILNFPAKICFTFMGWEMRFLKQCETEIEIAFQLSHKIREEKNEEKIG